MKSVIDKRDKRMGNVEVDKKSGQFKVTYEETYSLGDTDSVDKLKKRLKERLREIVKKVKLLKNEAEDIQEKLELIEEKERGE